MSGPPQDDPLAQLQPISALTPQPIEWLWRYRLALGKLSLLDGDPDQGKSLVALDLCARLTTGRPMPDGTPGPGVANALLLQAEDSAEDTVLPRLKVLGADIDRIFIWVLRTAQDRPLRLPADLDLLEQALRRSDARFLVIDPVMAFLDSSVFANSDQSVRRALDPLALILERCRCAGLMVRHLNKDGGTRALYRGGGSIGLQAACRTSWLIGRDPNDAATRVLAQEKNNTAAPQPSLAYKLVGEPDAPPTLEWLGASPWTADQLLAAAAAAPTPRDRARDFLAAFLKDGPRTSHEVWTAALANDQTKITTRRAAEKLSIRFQRVYKDGVRRTSGSCPARSCRRAPRASTTRFSACSPSRKRSSRGRARSMKATRISVAPGAGVANADTQLMLAPIPPAP